MLSTEPTITYQKSLFLRKNIDRAFSAAGIAPNIILDVQEPDTIKTYVELELGVGVLMDKMFDPIRDTELVQLDASHLFGSHITWIGLKRYQLQRNYIWHFVQLCNEELSLEEIRSHALFDEDKSMIIDYQI